MDKTERETHDFMNVESFSQLPFIRPAPTIKEKGIRLFGIEFGSSDATATATAATDESESGETATNNAFELDSTNKDNNITTTTENGESSRRFECHYCCRNFPTSQALGGHQNAHKRERQNAKRAHLQSAMVHGSFSDSHVYGLMNYNRFGSSVPSPTSAMPYPTWNSNTSSAITSSTSTGRFYGTPSYSHYQHQHQQQPINGSPLALWRIPTVQSSTSSNPSFNHERSFQHHPLPLFAGGEINVRASQVGASASQQNRYVYDSSKCSVPDHVSLDLHL